LYACSVRSPPLKANTVRMLPRACWAIELAPAAAHGGSDGRSQLAD
jgi:hypothetical protein